MNQTTQNKWDACYSQNKTPPEVAGILRENDFLLPETGTALDLACGLGANALFLAKRGLTVTALDISEVALQSVSAQAALEQLIIDTRVCDIQADTLPKQAYDVIIISRFLDRSLNNAIIEGLKPDGLLFYQTFTCEKTHVYGPKNPHYRLQPNELLKLFAPLRAVFYREYGLIGHSDYGLRNEAQFIGQKS